LASLDPAADPARIASAVLLWGDANVLSQAEQQALLLDKRLWKLRIQILAFTGVLLVVMTIVVSLIIYMMTIEKIHQIAMLKLIGARSWVIASMIIQEAGAVGVGGFGFGVAAAHLVFPYFPRRVVITPGDLTMLFLAVAAVSTFAGLLGIFRAMKVRAQEVLS